MDNANSKEYLEKILAQVLENMKRTMHVPSVQMTDVPRDSLGMNDDEEAALDDMDEDMNPDKRITQRKADKYVEKSGELSDSEDEEINESNGVRSQFPREKRRAAMNYRGIMDVGNRGDSGVETGSGFATPQHDSSIPDEADEMHVDTAVPATKADDTSVPNDEAQVPGQADQGVDGAPDEDVTMGDAEEAVPVEANGGDEQGPSSPKGDDNVETTSSKPEATTIKKEAAGEDLPAAAQENEKTSPGENAEETKSLEPVVEASS